MKLCIAAAAALLALAACTTSPQAPPLDTFNDRAALAERSVQLVQTSATGLLRAGSISVAQDQLIQGKVDLVHKGIVLAKSIEAGDPAAAGAQLAAELEALGVLTKQAGAVNPQLTAALEQLRAANAGVKP